MIVALLFFSQAAALEPLIIERGASLYAQRCSVPYCHGPAGTAGRAPALAGRNFETAELRRIVSEGIPSRGMPGFRQQLGDGGLDAVLAYVRSLPAPPPSNAPPPPAVSAVKLTQAATAGRDLFFDSSRFPGCSDCHAVGNMGSAVAAKLPSTITMDRIRGVRANHVLTARIPGESEFPAIIAQVTSDTMRVYDLSAPIPVLRSFPKATITLQDGSKWDHAAVVKRYSTAELELIHAYIQAR
jgi:mono/diheme cytochrome c family protein